VVFRLDPRLEADSLALAALGLCDLRLMNDRRYPWLLLVPRREGIAELHELARGDLRLLAEEVAVASAALAAAVPHDKINVAALGNIVRQLHVHVVARRRDDASWPGPVWGQGSPQPYAEAQRNAMLARLRAALPPQDGPRPT
jgi:diadenosine tetraphosphate (Ap4A) HIT family hydrolase